MQKHTESSRLMRGAWKAGHEYIFELRTEQDSFMVSVGCGGTCARYRARV